MTHPIVLVLDIAAFPPHRSEASVSQRVCLARWIGWAPWNWIIRVGATPKAAGRAFENLHRWPRESSPDASDKNVPYVRDLMDAAVEASPENALCGFVNSDIYPADHLFEDVNQRAEEGADYVLMHRTDVMAHQLDSVIAGASTHSKNLGKRASRAFSCDGVLMRPHVWRDELRPTFPDFVTGEPYWDSAMIRALDARTHLKPGKLRINAALHVRHAMGWGARTPYAKRALDLYTEFNEMLKGAKND